MSRVVAPLLCLLLGFSPAALAQAPASPAQKPPVSARGKTVPAKPPAPKPAAKPVAEAGQSPPPVQVVMPDAEKIVLLLRNTLITLNDAVQTGNFTVLRDKGAPGFRDSNSASRLGQAFAELSRSGVDLSAVSVVTPQLTEAPTLDQQKGMLHVQGYFPLQPQINFEVLYQSVGGRWRVFGLSVQPGTPAAQASPSPAPAPAAATPATPPAPAQTPAR